MALAELLQSSFEPKKILTQERVQAILPQLRQYIALWREYPDLFIDFMQKGNNPDKEVTFHLFFYQRIFLRIATRNRYVYAVFPRGYSKSFLATLLIVIRAILYPNCHLFVTAGGKEQAARILQEKITDICHFIPAFSREIDWSRGKSTTGKDYAVYCFKSGSKVENLAAKESSRGRRFHGGIIEECVGVDQKILQEVIIPTMNVSRTCMDGTTHEEEMLNQSQLYITTAGYKSTYSYQKLIQLLVRMLVEPDKAFVIGGTWRIPVAFGLQAKTFIDDLRRDFTFNEASFSREYESQWTGTIEDAFFDGEKFDRNRVLQLSENEKGGRLGINGYYILAVDVGRRGCDSVVVVLKVTPRPEGPPIISVVNIYVLSNMHFEQQSIMIKRLFYKFEARRCVVDANGIGIGLVDYLVKPQVDEVGNSLPDFGIYNDDTNAYRQYQTADCEHDAIYALKANLAINTLAHTLVQTALGAGHLRFLIDERIAKTKLLGTRKGAAMTSEQRAEYLRPYTLTSVLKEEMMNLREEREGINVILRQVNRRIKKDKVSALEYGVYYISQEEDEKRKKRKKFDVKKLLMMD